MKHNLPGERSHEEKIAQMIRVNQAGEYGAQRIYRGQLAVLGKSPCGDVLRHMAQQEDEHLAYFSEALARRKARPTVMMPIWRVGAFAMGAITALMGEKAAMACTVAVESVIDEHYAQQQAALEATNEEELRAAITKFRAEEKEHHDTALDRGAEESPVYGALTAIVSLHTKFAIWLSTRI